MWISPITLYSPVLASFAGHNRVKFFTGLKIMSTPLKFDTRFQGEIYGHLLIVETQASTLSLPDNLSPQIISIGNG